MAFDLKKQYQKVAIADLDIVNPYFRTKDSQKDFENKNIRLICSEYANTNLDIPALPDDLYSITDDKTEKVIIDIGGDDRGAYVLGRLTPKILEENDYNMYAVINMYRPLTSDIPSSVEVLKEIEAASGMKFTGIINNSNLAAETTLNTVIDSLEYANDVSKAISLPVVCTTINEHLYHDAKDKIDNLFPIHLQKKIF